MKVMLKVSIYANDQAIQVTYIGRAIIDDLDVIPPGGARAQVDRLGQTFIGIAAERLAAALRISAFNVGPDDQLPLSRDKVRHFYRHPAALG